MDRSVVVAFFMSSAGGPAPDGAYLARARVLCARGEALGGRLVAWGASLVAFAWDTDSIEAAVQCAAGVRDEAGERAGEASWSAGIAEGGLEPLGPNGAHRSLAWGPALASAASLARRARPGEVFVDPDVTALRGARLSVVEARAGVDADESGSALRLDLEDPWRPSNGAVQAPAKGGALAERIRRIARGEESAASVEALARLRRARARAEGGSASARCQAALALAVMLSIAGRSEEALLEALDALARAKESQDAKAVGACTALLAKLYAGVGLDDAAVALREGAGV